MDEREWLMSTNAAEMFPHLQLRYDFERGGPDLSLELLLRKCRAFGCAWRAAHGMYVDPLWMSTVGPAVTWAQYLACWYRNGRPDTARLLRSIFGNPFRPVRPAEWLHAREDLLPRMARTILENRDFEKMPLLGDALEELGADQELREHCRGRVRCPSCLGEGGVEEDSGGVTPWSEPISVWLRCLDCAGDGWVEEPVPFVLGDWVLDLLLGQI